MNFKARYQVAILWKKNPSILANNNNSNNSRLCWYLKKLMQDKVLQMAYSPLVQDQFKKVYLKKKKKKKE